MRAPNAQRDAVLVLQVGAVGQCARDRQAEQRDQRDDHEPDDLEKASHGKTLATVVALVLIRAAGIEVGGVECVVEQVPGLALERRAPFPTASATAASRRFRSARTIPAPSSFSSRA